MKKIIINICMFFAFSLTWLSAQAAQPYVEQNRVAYTTSILKAFNKTSNQAIYDTYHYISVIDTSSCVSILLDLRVQCLLSYADKYCAKLRGADAKALCKLYSDVIVVNKLSEKTFITTSERYRILTSAGKNFRTAFTDRLQQKYARLVTQFSLQQGADCKDEDFDCLAGAMDQFCLDYTNSHDLSWQYCMSATLWFIGVSKEPH